MKKKTKKSLGSSEKNVAFTNNATTIELTIRMQPVLNFNIRFILYSKSNKIVSATTQFPDWHRPGDTYIRS
jgi:hypothetical protein